jgi:uncharacterized protein YbaA (DUF1428 family)
MPRYVDGFLIPIPKKNLATYRKIARAAGKIWMEHGALQYLECVGDDVPYGKLTSFPRSVKLKPSETVWFSFIVYKSRRDRDRINAAVMKDPRMERMAKQFKGRPPFDGKRMIFGGFKAMVDM